MKEGGLGKLQKRMRGRFGDTVYSLPASVALCPGGGVGGVADWYS